MEAPSLPVVDFDRQIRLTAPVEEAVTKSPFSPMNLIAIFVILLAGFLLYKRFKDKKATEQAHAKMVEPSPIISPNGAEVSVTSS